MYINTYEERSIRVKPDLKEKVMDLNSWHSNDISKCCPLRCSLSFGKRKKYDGAKNKMDVATAQIHSASTFQWPLEWCEQEHSLGA